MTCTESSTHTTPLSQLVGTVVRVDGKACRAGLVTATAEPLPPVPPQSMTVRVRRFERFRLYIRMGFPAIVPQVSLEGREGGAYIQERVTIGTQFSDPDT